MVPWSLFEQSLTFEHMYNDMSWETRLNFPSWTQITCHMKMSLFLSFRTRLGVRAGDVTMTYESIYNDVNAAMEYVHAGDVRLFCWHYFTFMSSQTECYLSTPTSCNTCHCYIDNNIPYNNIHMCFLLGATESWHCEKCQQIYCPRWKTACTFVKVSLVFSMLHAALSWQDRNAL